MAILANLTHNHKGDCAYWSGISNIVRKSPVTSRVAKTKKANPAPVAISIKRDRAGR